MDRGPRRIICLTAETVDLLYRLGVSDRIVGVSGYTVFPPEARKKPFVSAFTTIRYDVIESLKPDLIVGFSDLQAEAAKELGRRGYAVLLTNQRTLQETLETMVIVGRIVGKGDEAESLVETLNDQIEEVRRAAKAHPRRPKIYFEEWPDPLISGIAWVSDLIETAGGENVFPELYGRRSATERVVQSEAVIQQMPDIIAASWCGRKVDRRTILSRPGWEVIPAVRSDQVHEIKSAYCLQPGPSLVTEGLPRLHALVEAWHQSHQTGQRVCNHWS